MNLNAPTQLIFIIAVIIAVVALVGTFVAIPFVSAYAFWLMTLAFVVLAAGVLFRGA